MSNKAAVLMHQGKVIPTDSPRKRQKEAEADELICLDQERLDNDEENAVAIGQSMKTLHAIDRNI